VEAAEEMLVRPLSKCTQEVQAVLFVLAATGAYDEYTHPLRSDHLEGRLKVEEEEEEVVVVVLHYGALGVEDEM
jgi:hypothetical protein